MKNKNTSSNLKKYMTQKEKEFYELLSIALSENAVIENKNKR